MKKTIAFVLLACMLSGCAQLEMPRITAAAQQENDQCVLPFSQEVNGEEWTLVAWDSGEDWEALNISLQKGGENPVVFELRQGETTERLRLNPDESGRLDLPSEDDFALYAQFDGEVLQRAQVEGKLKLQ